jgi:hypothetical protein
MAVIDKEAFYQRIVGYFDQQVLASYRNEPDKYILKTDHFEGRLQAVVDEDGVSVAADYIDIRFGYHTRTGGDLALAVFLPDLVDKSSAHIPRWAAYHLSNQELTAKPDKRFEMWKARYLEGSWNVENGPRSRLEETVAIINALCLEVSGVERALFKFASNPLLNFPAAQNTHAYQDAHKELYGYIIDGLDKETIKRIAALRGLTLNVSSDKTRKALEKALPAPSLGSVLQSALDKVSTERYRSGHNVRSLAQRFPAFEEFTNDLEAVVIGLRELLTTLENVLGMSGERAKKRQQAKVYSPRIDRDRPPEAHYSITQLPQIVGKTVQRVEYGFCKHIEGSHESEGMILYFTDGSILGIDTGSNACNVADEHEGLQPDEFHADVMLKWVPPPL